MIRFYYAYLISTILLMTATASFSQEQKVPKSNEFYHIYKKEGDIIRVYDVDSNLVREVHLDKDIAYDFFEKKIFLSHLESKYLVNTDFFKSKKTIEYLYDSKERRNSMQIGEEKGYVKKYKTNLYGFREMLFSTSIYDNKNSKYELPKQKSDNNGFDSFRDNTIYDYKSEQKFYEKERFFVYKLFKNDKKIKDLYVEFNEQNLVSQVFLIEINNTENKRTGNINYKKAEYDSDGNIVELKEWRSKKYEQIESIFSGKKEEYILEKIFKRPQLFFKLTLLDVKLWTYKDGRLKSSRVLDGSSNEEMIKEEFEYDSKKRLVKIISNQNDKVLGEDIFKYE